MELGRYRQQISAGFGIAIVGYTSSFAVVLAGLRAVGATRAQATSGLVVLCLAVGVATLLLSRRHRIPITIAWSTPGAAVLVSAGAGHGGWPAAVGAFLVVGLLVVLTGLWPRLGALITAIPAPIAQAMLAGVVLQICLTPVHGLAAHPAQVLPILLVWLALTRVAPRWAVPGAFVATLVVVAILAADHGGAPGPLLPHPVLTSPRISWPALVGIALPLYVVTMAAQNVPGVAIMSSYGYTIPWREAMAATGLGSVLAAPFGGHAINLAAISASVPASSQAHPDPARRWPAATTFGVTYLCLTAVTTALTTLLAVAPVDVVGTVAGLGLLGTLGSSLGAAIGDPQRRTAAAITFVVAASGVTIAGVASATWALVAGLVVQRALLPRTQTAA
ncbi:MAG TPA: benzoate/H(+) symporter BenE family transporter [Solirubrobacteraceae bacterium]|nr:benzoate/H(+) symporter BenE family transporter [Solirubrobacteraceae bacterium]